MRDDCFIEAVPGGGDGISAGLSGNRRRKLSLRVFPSPSGIASRKNQVHPHGEGLQTEAQPKGPVDASIPPSHPIFNNPHGLHDQADCAECIDGLVV